MIESGYYPPGAEFDPNAPYNQVDYPEEEFEITVSQTLSKTVTVFTSNYNLEVDYDEDGCYRNCDTSDTNWQEVYEEDYHTPLQLIGFLKRLLEGNEPISDSLKKQLIKECENWCEDELAFVEE
jgi:hypothetical protein